jgi:polysaccharide biosynthesis/export protein
MKNWFFAAMSLFIILSLGSCTINRNVMFRTDHDYAFNTPADSLLNEEYRINVNDLILLRLFSNGGAAMLDITAGTSDSRQFAVFPNTTYLVERDGYIELPEIGEVMVLDMTLNEAERHVESLYANFYNDPFAIVEVVNKRVIVFPGNGGTAAVVPLTNRNTTVIECLAQAGGVTLRGNARRIKLIRTTNFKNEVYLMDLSTIEGIKYANMLVQANDVIYVEPVPEIAGEILKDVAPFVTLVSGVALIYAILIGTF